MTMPTTGTSAINPVLRITVPRRIEASPEEVFDAWAEPDLFRRWLEPHRAILRKAAVDELWYWEADHAGRLWAHYCRYVRVERRPGPGRATRISFVGWCHTSEAGDT